MTSVLTPTESRQVLGRLAQAAKQDAPDAWAAGAQLMLGWDGRTWLMVDDLARRWSSYGEPIVTGAAGWLSPHVAEPSGFVAALTSMHSDGRIRQRATRVLASTTGDLAAMALAVRCLDHVPEVRTEAEPGLARRAGERHAHRALGVLLAGRARRHADRALHSLVSAMLAHFPPPVIVERLLVSPDTLTRRWAHQFGHDHGLLSAQRLARIVATDRDQRIRRQAAAWLAPIATAEQLRMLLQGRSANGRFMAVQTIRDGDLDTALLTDALCDRTARVRRAAQWRAGRLGMDVAPVYREVLVAQPSSPRKLAAAIDALGEVGGVDVAAISPFLRTGHVAVRAAAATTIGALGDSSQVRQILVPLLLDASPRVTRAAARSLVAANAPAQDAEQAWAAHDQPWSRRAAWQVMRATSTWAGVVADLNAAADVDPTLRRLGTRGLRDWLHTTAAKTYGAPTVEQLEQIERLLPSSGLNPHEAEMIAFHTGFKRRA